MFKNCVFKPDVNTVKWFKAAGVRAIKTMAQTAIATIGASATMGEVNWVMVGSASLLAGVVSNCFRVLIICHNHFVMTCIVQVVYSSP